MSIAPEQPDIIVPIFNAAAMLRDALQSLLHTLSTHDRVILIDDASTEAAMLTAPFLQTQIDLWLAETWHMHGDALAARTALERAQTRLEGSEQGWLNSWAAQVANYLT